METANWTPHPSKKLKEEEFRFGEKAGFWERYDTVAEKFDADMLGRLNENLDSLLIFVSLKRVALRPFCERFEPSGL